MLKVANVSTLQIRSLCYSMSVNVALGAQFDAINAGLIPIVMLLFTA